MFLKFLMLHRLMEEAGDGGGAGGGGDGGDGGGNNGGDGGEVEWRSLLAGDDEKLGKRLERFTTPTDFAKSWLEKDQLISRGELLKPLPENATEDDIKAFREQQGIPAEAAGYLEHLPDGLVVGDEDKPIVESFVAKMHSIHASPAVVQAGLAWYNEFMDGQAAAQEERDAEDKKAMEDAMREAWGTDYRANVNVTNALLGKYLSDEDREFFNSLRGPDGKAALNHPGIAQMLVNLGRELNPVSTILPADKSDQKGLENRIAEIEKVMRENRTAYNKDQKMQDEYMRLLEVRDKLKERAA